MTQRDDESPDREAILARRRHFIARALPSRELVAIAVSGLTTACHPRVCLRVAGSEIPTTDSEDTATGTDEAATGTGEEPSASTETETGTTETETSTESTETETGEPS